MNTNEPIPDPSALTAALYQIAGGTELLARALTLAGALAKGTQVRVRDERAADGTTINTVAVHFADPEAAAAFAGLAAGLLPPDATDPLSLIDALLAIPVAPVV